MGNAGEAALHWRSLSFIFTEHLSSRFIPALTRPSPRPRGAGQFRTQQIVLHAGDVSCRPHAPGSQNGRAELVLLAVLVSGIVLAIRFATS